LEVSEFDMHVKEWGKALCYFHQARVNLVDPDFNIYANNDDKLCIFRLLLTKAKAPLITSFHMTSFNSDFKLWFLGYRYFSSFYIARLCAMLGQNSEFYYWFSRSKLEMSYPPLECIYQRDFGLCNYMIKVIVEERDDQTYERINFYHTCLSYEKKMTYTASNERNDLSQSMLMRSTLSKSTFDILIEADSPLNKFLAFWKPVIVPETSMAKKRLEQRMSLYGVETRKEVPGDGNCQMHSLSDQLTGTFNYAKFIRREIVSWIRAHGDLKLANGALLKEFIHDKTFEQYCNDMARDGTWGDHLTLIAATELFNIKVIIISSVPGDSFIIEIVPELSKARRILMLSHYAEYHYGTIQYTDLSLRNMMIV